jgi:hypothetical protein
MSTKCLSAFTAHTDMPPYINASLNDKDQVEIIVRGEATIREGGKWPVADCAQMKMTREQFVLWATGALENLK